MPCFPLAFHLCRLNCRCLFPVLCLGQDVECGCNNSALPFIYFVITSPGEEGTYLCASRAFVCLFCACWFLSFFSSSWCQGLAAASDCGTPCTFLLTFLLCLCCKVT